MIENNTYLKFNKSFLLNFLEKTGGYFLYLFILTTVCNAQSERKIYGYVIDKDSGTPLVGANIIIEGTGKGGIADTKGYYQFSNLLSGEYTLTVSYIGYKTKTIDDIKVTLDFPTEVDFKLTPSNYELEKIIVTGSEELESKIGNISVLNRADIEKKQSQTIGEILEEIPGVEIQSTGAIGSSQHISIRGSQANHVLILLDGIALNNQSGGEAELANIPVNIIEKIEVHEGGSSSRFGSGAIGGVINIITRNQFINELKINSSIGSLGLRQIEPVIAGSFKNLNYFFSYNYIESKGDYDYDYVDNAGKKQSAIRKNSEFGSNSFFTKINYQFDKSVLTFNWQNFNNDRGILI